VAARLGFRSLDVGLVGVCVMEVVVVPDKHVAQEEAPGLGLLSPRRLGAPLPGHGYANWQDLCAGADRGCIDRGRLRLHVAGARQGRVGRPTADAARPLRHYRHRHATRGRPLPTHHSGTDSPKEVSDEP
jgi:hypothetical protein